MGCNPGKEKKRDYSKYLDYFNKRSGQGKYIMRELALSDLKGDVYLNLIKQLKNVDEKKADDQVLKKQILDIFNDDTYVILIWTFPSPKNYIVGSATLHFQKSIGDQFAKSCHISHVVIDQDHHGKGLGKTLQEALTVIGFREEKVSKLIDDTEFIEDNKAHKIITKEDFDTLFADITIGVEPKEIRFLDHKTLVVSLNSYIKYDEDKRGDKQFLVSCSLDPNLKLWDLELNTCLQTIDSTHAKTITTSLLLNDLDGQFKILTGSMDQTIQLIDLDQGVLISSFIGHQDSITCLVQAHKIFDEFEGFLSGSDDGTIKIWKFECSDPVSEIKVNVPIKSMISLRDFSENVKFAVFVGLNNGKISIYDILGQKLLNQLIHSEKNNESITCLEIFKNVDNTFLLSGCSDGSIKVWDPSKGDMVKSYQETNQMITCLSSALFKGKNIFISGSLDEKNGEVKLWNLEDDKSFKTIKNHGFGVKSMCYLEKYEYLAVSWNNGFRVLKLNKELS